MMDWIKHTFTSLAFKTLKAGPIPSHVAVIMDGNRRFARHHNLQTIQGHAQGGDVLLNTIKWCVRVGVDSLSVYAFSIDNFKRPKDEVDGLMNLLRERMKELKDHHEVMENIRIRALGDLSLLPDDLEILIHELVDETRENTQITLNICISYTATYELCEAIKNLTFDIACGDVREDALNVDLFEKYLLTSGSGPVDILVRTSGESRLSDFLVWQTNTSCMMFYNVMWPEFGLKHFLYMILYYQRNHHKITSMRQNIG
eukprot:TRINITY_DN6275_c0_g1_i1.p1 TRINITY_DN6275_c0_g1~~TRINITY_DN6275_c0_g1_i1.p1  ORF type:complete len:258 (+),score=23.82 TRINITY_DN6275_c0_g1_i1:54-827(+)